MLGETPLFFSMENIILNALLPNLGGPFRWNYDKFVNINERIPNCHKNIILFCHDLNITVPKQNMETPNQIISNNRFICVNGLSVYYKD